MNTLTTKQKKFLPAIEWLIDPVGYRAEGRSTLLVYAYIRLALKNIHNWIRVRDHFPDRQADNRLLDMIFEETHNIYDIEVNFTNNSFVINGIKEKKEVSKE